MFLKLSGGDGQEECKRKMSDGRWEKKEKKKRGKWMYPKI